MKYLFFIGDAPDSPTAQTAGDSGSATGAPDVPLDGTYDWVAEMDSRGVRTDGDRLRPARDATTVRVRGGELLVTDGPFIEGKEYIAGFDVIDCADLDEAIEIAGKHPMARFGLIEIRPVWPIE